MAEPTQAKDAAMLDRERELSTHRRYWALRRVQDVVLSLLGLVVLSPLMLLIGLMIVLDDPRGGPIFSQIRCGRNGRPFRLYKFRSMCVDAEQQLPGLMEQNERDGPAFKIKNDPRITRAGSFLRRSCLDELPQLWNILKGDMSLVGPRPALPREVEQYNDYQRQRLYITPGLTCYWQIRPDRNEIPFEEWVEMDLRYIRERSFWVDWKILFQTVRTVLRGTGQ